jgi:hypothetical protein
MRHSDRVAENPRDGAALGSSLAARSLNQEGGGGDNRLAIRGPPGEHDGKAPLCAVLVVYMVTGLWPLLVRRRARGTSWSRAAVSLP